jgi:succinate dehydrogenase / fumarate reductase cytochrome b subunit
VKKVFMAITGLLLCGFITGHLVGNLLIYISPEAFNKYGHTLTSNPLIYVAEAGLIALFLVHMFFAFKTIIENKKARPQKYYMKTKTGRGSTFASSTMPYTGVIIFIFLVLHVTFIKYGAIYSVSYDGIEMRDLYRLCIEYFSNPLITIGYVIAMGALGIHVSHGFWSAFQSLGFNHPKYTPSIECLSKLFAVVVGLGFAALPIYCYLQGGNYHV